MFIGYVSSGGDIMIENKKKLVDTVAKTFEEICKKELSERLNSLYVVGSYAFDKISLDKPDINFLIILKEGATPEDHIKIGKICRKMTEIFKDRCSVRIEFRPFRYIYPKIRKDYDIFLNPIVLGVQEIEGMGCIFNKWFTEGLKNANRLLYGEDFLKTLAVGEITKQDIFQGANFDLSFFTIPLTKAPSQYDEDEFDLLFNEAMTNGKNMCYLGIEIAMSEEELRNKEYTKYIQSKETITDFYRERYGERASELVDKIFDARENYLRYKKDRQKAEEIFGVALSIGNLIRYKLFSEANK